ncbi:MAG: hypothetical protein GY754_20140 [bacterium]|nr:hypothetical protein [bacterium]
MFTVILKILLLGVLYAGILYALSRILDDFVLELPGLLVVTAILVGVDIILSNVLGAAGWVVNKVTFGIFSAIISWAIYTTVIWVTDKITDKLEITKTSSLLISGAVLAVVNWIWDKIF